MTKDEKDKLKPIFETADRFGFSETATAHLINVCSLSLDNNN